MNIAINTLSLNRTKAGMGNYIYNLVNNLAKLDKKNNYHIFVSDKNREFFRIDQENFRIINLGKGVTKGLNRFLWEQISLPKYIRKHGIDILHSPGFVISLRSRVKNVLTIADMTFMNYPQVHTLFKRTYFSLFMPPSIKKADRVLAISESTKKDVIRAIKVNPEKIKVTYLAYGKEFRVMDKKKARELVNERYGIDKKFIIFVGMIEPRKNLPRIFKAFSELKKEGIPHKLVIVGKKGWKYKGMFRQINKLDLGKDVMFTGYVPDSNLAILYNAADMLAYPCLYEGFGLPILEAMACGCPVITSNISSMPEVAGNAALLVDPKEMMQIKSAMSKLINNSKFREGMIKKGLKRSSQFSWKKCAQETMNVYEALA